MAEWLEIAYVLETHRMRIERAMAEALRGRGRQEHVKRERRATRKAPPQPSIGEKPAAMEARAAVGHAFWTWLVPATGVVAGTLAMLAVLLVACFLL